MQVAAAALLLGTIGVVMACGSHSPSSVPPSDATGCLKLPGQSVDGIRWNEAGSSLAVTSFDDSTADGVIWRLDYPSLNLEELVRKRSILTLTDASYGPHGIVWLENNDGEPELWRLDKASPVVLARVPEFVLNLRETTTGFVGLDVGDAGGRIVSVAIDRGVGRLVPLFDIRLRVESFDISADGKDLVAAVSDGPGTPVVFVVWRQGTKVQSIQPPGRLVGAPKLGPTDVIYYEDHDVGALMHLRTQTQSVARSLSEDVSEAAISPSGRLVAYTGVTPDRTDLVCVRPLPAIADLPTR